jgi:hypothetical protein
MAEQQSYYSQQEERYDAPAHQQHIQGTDSGLDYPQPATLREGPVVAVNTEPVVHQVPIHDNTKHVGAPVHTVVPPVTGPGVAVAATTRTKTRTSRSHSGAGIAIGSLALGLLVFLVIWEIILVAVASRILYVVKHSRGVNYNTGGVNPFVVPVIPTRQLAPLPLPIIGT